MAASATSLPNTSAYETRNWIEENPLGWFVLRQQLRISVLGDGIAAEHKELQEVLQRQGVLARFGELALLSDDLDEILTEACRLVGDALGTDLAKVLELDEDGDTLLVRAGVGWRPGVIGVLTLRVSDKTSEGHALKTGQPMVSADIAKETRFEYPDFLIKHGVRALANVIIPGSKGRLPFGILQIDSRQPREFTERDLVFLSSYANLLAAAVERLRVFGESQGAAARLRESEARLARAIVAANMGTWEWDLVSKSLHVSAGFEALYSGSNGGPPTFRVLRKAVCSDAWVKLRGVFKEALRGKGTCSLAAEFRVVLPDTTVRWLRVTGTAERNDNGAPTRLAGVAQDITARKDAEARMLYMARHDSLTGLLNGSTLRERLSEELQRCQRGETCAVLALDLDKFKEVNDTLGHAAGDAVLRSVASRLRKTVREIDIIARPGGDEFVIVQTKLHEPNDAVILATRVIAELSRPHEIDGMWVGTGVSIGIAIAPADGTEVEKVIRCADLALYGAKITDQPRFRFFEPEMQAEAENRRQLAADLRRAVDNGEFELHYQPLVHLDQNRITCFEALVRWRHPARGLLLPSEFIPLAEETGLIEPLGEWILNTACADAAEWPSEVKVAVNLSAAQFSKGVLVGTVSGALERAELLPQRLELEITETLLLQDTEDTLSALGKLRDQGVSISMDDFGVGYSSLSYLSRFPFDKVKIDRSFVASAEPGTSGAAIVRAVADLCRTLGIIATAEGIETQKQFEQIASLGCTEGQGFFFGTPRPLADLSTPLD